MAADTEHETDVTPSKVRRQYRDPGQAGEPVKAIGGVKLVEGKPAPCDLFVDVDGKVTKDQPERGWKVLAEGDDVHAHHLRYAGS